MIARRRPARRNPRAPAAPKNPTVVLVRRFDPTGETLPRWDVLARDADGAVAFLSPPAADKVAKTPPGNADLHVGDLIVTVPAEALSDVDNSATRLYVVTPDGVKVAPRVPKDLDGPWLTKWGQTARDMLRSSGTVDRRRIAMAACDCAEAVLHLVPAGEDRPRIVIEAARAWCLGRVSIGDVRAAAQAASVAHDAATRRARNGRFSDRSGSRAINAAIRAASAASDGVRNAAVDAAVDAADAAAAAAHYSSAKHYVTSHREHALLVERWIPLPVVLLSRLGYPDAIPFDPSMVPVEHTSERANPMHRNHARSRRR